MILSQHLLIPQIVFNRLFLVRFTICGQLNRDLIRKAHKENSQTLPMQRSVCIMVFISLLVLTGCSDSGSLSGELDPSVTPDTMDIPLWIFLI